MKKLICESCGFFNIESRKCHNGRILPTKKNQCNIYLEREYVKKCAQMASVKTHGGARSGAGRPKLAKKKQVRSFALTPEIIDFIDSSSRKNNMTKSEFVNWIIFNIYINQGKY